MTAPPLSSPHRALGFWPVLALVVGNMIGSGIYLLPATLAPLGRNALIGWAVTIAGAMCLALVFARLAARMPAAGGPYAYAEAAFGPVVGFAVAWSYWALLWAGNGAVAVALVGALGVVVPPLNGGVPAVATALALIWGLVLVNLRGVAVAGRVQVVTTVLKLVPLAGVVLLAAWLLLRDGAGALATNPPVPLAWSAVSGAVALGFWGFIGIESATVPADRVADADRLVPRATLLGTALTGLVYVAVAGAIGMMMPTDVVAASPAPVAAFLGRTFGAGIAAVVALFMAISAFGALNGFILLQGEMPRAMARGGVFPAWLGRDNAHGVAANAHVVAALLATAVVVLSYTDATGSLFAEIAAITLAAGMLAYLVSGLAAVKLLRGDVAGRIAGLLATAFVVWMIYGLGAHANAWGAGVMVLGLPLFLATRRARTAR